MIMAKEHRKRRELGGEGDAARDALQCYVNR